jgi:hypothetical protein
VCDPFRVVMWFGGGGRFPGALPPATLPVPFQGAWGGGHRLSAHGEALGSAGLKPRPSEGRNRVLPQPARVLSIGGRTRCGLRVSKVLDNWGATFRNNPPLPHIAIHLAAVNLPPVRYFPPISGAPWTLATPVLKASVPALEVCMNRRIETSEGKVYRRARGRDILCRLTYEVTPFRDGLFRWFLMGIEELE